MDIKVLMQVMRTVWLITPEAAENYSLIVQKFFAGEIQSISDEKPTEASWAVDGAGKRIGSIADATNNGVAVLNLRGAVMKYDYCGTPGTQSLMNALQQANDNPAISAIVLQIDSPGGSVDGTQQFANAIKNSSKPVVAYVNGMMCSAAMWIGSAASLRIASSNTDTIGSIGTMASWRDWSKAMEKNGVVNHEVYATNSTEKNKPFREAEGKNAEGKINYEPLIKTWLDPTNDEFTGAIQENLPNADKTVLNGAAFIAKDAKKKGLIDKMGSFNDAVQAAIKLGKQKQLSQKFQNIMSFPKTLKAASATKFEVVEGGFLLEEAQLTNIETALASAETSASDLANAKTAKEIAETAQQKAEQDLATANTKITGLEAEVKKLGKQDGAPFTEAAAIEDGKAVKYQNAETKAAMEMSFQQELLKSLN